MRDEGCPNSMEVMRWHKRRRELQWLDPRGADMDCVIDVLNRPFYKQPTIADDQQPVRVEHVNHDDDIGDTCLILHAEEDDPFCSAWSLPDNHAASDANQPAGTNPRKI